MTDRSCFCHELAKNMQLFGIKKAQWMSNPMHWTWFEVNSDRFGNLMGQFRCEMCKALYKARFAPD